MVLLPVVMVLDSSRFPPLLLLYQRLPFTSSLAWAECRRRPIVGLAVPIAVRSPIQPDRPKAWLKQTFCRDRTQRRRGLRNFFRFFLVHSRVVTFPRDIGNMTFKSFQVHRQNSSITSFGLTLVFSFSHFPSPNLKLAFRTFQAFNERFEFRG